MRNTIPEILETIPEILETIPVILAGGKGTRLKSVVGDRPKPLAEVNGRPFITYLLDQLIDTGFTNCIISIENTYRYGSNNIREVIGDVYREILNIEYIVDMVSNAGTGNAILDIANSEYTKLTFNKFIDLLVMNGDTFIDIDLMDFISSRSSFVLSLANGPINAGIYLFSLSTLKDLSSYYEGYVPSFCSIDEHLLSMLVTFGKTITPYVTNKPFIDIGTPETYAQAGEFMNGIKHNWGHIR